MSRKLSQLIKEGMHKAKPARCIYVEVVEVDGKEEVLACPLGMAALAATEIPAKTLARLTEIEIEGIINREAEGEPGYTTLLKSKYPATMNIYDMGEFGPSLLVAVVRLTDGNQWSPDSIIEWLESVGY